MVAKGIAPEFAERVFEQIRGFGEYGFPESHAASFALIAYATAWLKCHYPVEFACALLNAQPMGFYSPATIVEDARRHGVEVLPVDVRASDWDCTLESVEARTLFAVRLGFRYVKGLGNRGRADRGGPPRRGVSVAGGLRPPRRPGRDVLQALAEAGAFDGFESSRRTALWEAKALAGAARIPCLSSGPRPTGLRAPRASPRRSGGTTGPPTTAPAVTRWSRSVRHCVPRGFPTRRRGATAPRPARALRRGRHLPPAAGHRHRRGLHDARGRDRLRQRRPLAQGVTRHRVLVKTSPLLGVTGRLESQQGVAHLIAEQVWVPQLEQPVPTGGSRDFQ